MSMDDQLTHSHKMSYYVLRIISLFIILEGEKVWKVSIFFMNLGKIVGEYVVLHAVC